MDNLNNTNNNSADDSRNRYDILPYTQRNFPLSSEIRYPGYASADTEENVHLRDYFRVVLKRKWIVLAFFISVVVTTTIFTSLAVPVYQSTVTIKIDSQNPSTLSLPGL